MIDSIYWMDGYGPYVWAAWLIAGLAISVLFAWTYLSDFQVRGDLGNHDSDFTCST